MEQNIRINKLKEDWLTNSRWDGIKRTYTAEEVIKLRGSVDIEYSIARQGAQKFWHKLKTQPFIGGLGALT
ncbi:MAG: isocitrate lyase, partial [Bacteroidota bacterium]